MTKNTDLAHLAPNHSDEIDLGELIRNILSEWKLIIGITAAGAVLGVMVALLLPKQYRVEAIIDRPTVADIQALLSQDLIHLTREDIVNELLKNLTSRNLVQRALANTNLLIDDTGSALTLEEQFTAVSEAASSLRIAPAEYDFIELAAGAQQSFDQISFSSLSSEPADTQLWMNELLSLAENRTIESFNEDLQGQRNIAIAKLEQQLSKIKNVVRSAQTDQIATYERALTVAAELNIVDPTSWEALIHGVGRVPQITNMTPIEPELYLRGKRILTAELGMLKNSEPTIRPLTTGYDEFGNPIELSPVLVNGQLEALKAFQLDTSSVVLILDSVRAVIPANSEKPNRKLIAVAATLLAGFFSLFVVLIKLAVSNKAKTS